VAHSNLPVSSLTNFQSHYFLGRFLGLAHMARDPQTWQVEPERVVEILLQIADEHDAAGQAEGSR
jgi:hypothetical protein